MKIKELKHASEYDFEPIPNYIDLESLNKVIDAIEVAFLSKQRYCEVDIRLSSETYVLHKLLKNGYKFIILRNHKDFTLYIGITW